MPEGFYWLNDVNRYGWEPVQVRDDFSGAPDRN